MAGAFGTKQLVVALGLGVAITGYQYYGAVKSAEEKEASAQIKTIPNGLKDGFATEEKVAEQKRSFEKAKEDEKDELVEIETKPAVASKPVFLNSPTQPTMAPKVAPTVAAAAVAAPGADPTKAATMPATAKGPQPDPSPASSPTPLPPSLVEKPIDAKAQAIVTAAKRAELIAELKEKGRCAAESGNVLNVRYKQMLMRVSFTEGFNPAAFPLKGFIGRAKEAVVGVADLATCKTDHCFGLDSTLLETVAKDKSNNQKFECGSWLLVSEKVGDTCSKESNFKTLSLAREAGDKCVVGSLVDVQVFGGATRTVANAAESATVTTYLTVQRKPVQVVAPSEEHDEE